MSSKAAETFRKNLRFFLAKRGMSQSDLARSSGIHRAHVSSYATGRTAPSLESLEAIARALEVPVSSLLDSAIEWPSGQETKNKGDDLQVIGNPAGHKDANTAHESEGRKEHDDFSKLVHSIASEVTASILKNEDAKTFFDSKNSALHSLAQAYGLTDLEVSAVRRMVENFVLIRGSKAPKKRSEEG